MRRRGGWFFRRRRGNFFLRSGKSTRRRRKTYQVLSFSSFLSPHHSLSIVFRPFFWHQTPTETNISVKSDFQLKSAHANTSQTFYCTCPPARGNRPKPGGFPGVFCGYKARQNGGGGGEVTKVTEPTGRDKRKKTKKKNDKKKKRQKRHYPPGGFQSPCPRRSRGLHRTANRQLGC